MKQSTFADLLDKATSLEDLKFIESEQIKYEDSRDSTRYDLWVILDKLSTEFVMAKSYTVNNMFGLSDLLDGVAGAPAGTTFRKNEVEAEKRANFKVSVWGDLIASVVKEHGSLLFDK